LTAAERLASPGGVRRSRSAASLGFLLLLVFTKPAARADGVGAAPLEVRETNGVQRRTWPVTIGVPLPKEWLGGGQAVSVVESDGQAVKPLPTQSRALSYWGGRGARWLLVDFQTDLGPRQTRRFYLHPAVPPAPKVAVSVQQRGGDVEIDNGVMRLVAGKSAGGVFRLKSLHGKEIKLEAVRAEMNAGGRSYSASAPQVVSIEEGGPLRATVALSGDYGGGVRYEIRLQIAAGQPYLRVLHTFIAAGAEAFTPLQRLRVRVPFAGKGEATYGARLADGKRIDGKVAGKGVSLAQIDAATLRRDDALQSGRLAGWFELRRPDFALGLDAPFFWQEYPQAVHFSPGELAYDLRADFGGPASIGVGAAKTHDFLLVFGKGSDLVVEPGRGTVALAEPTWTAKSGALLNAVDPAREARFIGEVSDAFGRTLRSIEVEVWDEAGACPQPAGKAVEVRRTGAYGMLNWGDWNYRGYHDDTKGCDAWGNQEYDLTQVLGLLFAATGRAEVYDFLVAAARHYGDVDVIHHQPQHPDWVGMNHPKNPQHFSFDYGGVDLGHTWVEGLFTYHFLTGDARAWKAAIGISDYLVRRARNVTRGNPRQYGWPALALAAAYEATGKGAYLDAAREYARVGVRQHEISAKIGKDWKLGILADGVSYVDAIGSGDPSLRPWLKEYAAAVTKLQPQDIRFYPAVAYVGRVTDNGPMMSTARDVAARIPYGDWAKPFTIGARTGFRILSQVDGAR